MNIVGSVIVAAAMFVILVAIVQESIETRNDRRRGR